MARISPREIPTVLPSREVKVSFEGTKAFESELLAAGDGFSSLIFFGGPSSFSICSPVTASSAANPAPAVFPHRSQNRGKSSASTSSIASRPSLERRSRYPCPRKEIDASRSKTRNGILARSRRRAKRREATISQNLPVFWFGRS